MSKNCKMFIATAIVMVIAIGLVSGLIYGVSFLYDNALGGDTESLTDSGNSENETASVNDMSVSADNNANIPAGQSHVVQAIVSANNADEFNISDEANEFIIDYFNHRYLALGSLSYTSLDEFYDRESREGSIYLSFCNNSLEYLINARNMRDNDLRFSNATVGITYNSVSNEGDTLVINLCINDALDFNYLHGIISYSCGMEQIMTLTKVGDGYKILSHIEETDVNYLIQDTFDAVLEKNGQTIDGMQLTKIDGIYEEVRLSLQEEAEDNIEEQRADLKSYNSNNEMYATKKTADNTYDRGAALEYSYKWVDKINIIRSDEYAYYDIYGGNCQNYVSQCIFAGGVPMDYKGYGTAQWKWYGTDNDESERQVGRSTSWSGTQYFYEYVEENQGSGMVAEICENIYSGREGDVIQYVVDGRARHTVIISKVIKDSDGNVVDYLINSNTTDRIDFPLSAYGYTDIWLIRIVGWNN